MSFERLSRAAVSVLHGSGIVLFIGMVLLVLAQVVARKFFEPLVWSEELARYTFIWVAFIGWVIASRNKSHIRISLVTGPTLSAHANAALIIHAGGDGHTKLLTHVPRPRAVTGAARQQHRLTGSVAAFTRA